MVHKGMNKHIPVMADHWLNILLFFLIALNSRVHGSTPFVNITVLDSAGAVQEGAVCLDGSPPAYYFFKGFGSGVNNWIVYFEGGGWCDSESTCLQRAQSWLGSSSLRKGSRAYFAGLRSKNQTENPEFYNWNKVQIAYCDGSSYMSDVEKIDPETNLRLRGVKIFNAVMEDMLARGMKNADNAILAGGSAGGLATILNCDLFRALLPNANRVKCLADCGVFIRAKDLPGTQRREGYYAEVVKFHGLANLLPKSCTSRMNPSLCMFPEYLIQDIQTPLFLVDSTFDSWKIQNQLDPTPCGQVDEWNKCANQTKPCTSAQLQSMKDFGAAFIETLRKIGNCSSRGMFIHSCYQHGLIYSNNFWNRSPILAGKTLAQAFGDWYFDRSPFQEIDTQMDDLLRNCTPRA